MGGWGTLGSCPEFLALVTRAQPFCVWVTSLPMELLQVMRGILGQLPLLAVLLLWVPGLLGKGVHQVNGDMPSPYPGFNQGKVSGQYGAVPLGVPSGGSDGLGLLISIWPRDTEAQRGRETCPRSYS